MGFCSWPRREQKPINHVEAVPGLSPPAPWDPSTKQKRRQQKLPGKARKRDKNMKGRRVAPTPAAIGLIATAIIIVAAMACGSATSSASSDPAPTPTLAPLPTAASGALSGTATPEPAQVATPVLVTAPATEGPSDEELIAQGKEIFEKTAGGVGCALCHGLDARGDPSQGAPDNRGASADTIFAALASRPQMSFITLTNDEVDAVAAYLAFLATQP